MSDPKVTIRKGGVNAPAAQTPSQAIIAGAMQPAEVVDARNRVIVLAKPSLLSQFRLMEALGDAAANDVYRAMVLPLLYVSSLDGVFQSPLTTKDLVEALIKRLDDDGYEAVRTGIKEHFTPKKDEGESEAALKKLVGATEIRQALLLVKNGVPFDVAFSVDSSVRTAWSIIFQELESGKRYDFSSHTFEARG